MGTIASFTGDYRFLSNFYEAPVWFVGKQYRTVEHAYQAAKTSDPKQREAVRRAETPGQAKRMGRQVVMRPDWDDVKVNVMHQLLRQKFGVEGLNPSITDKLKNELLATGDAELIEGNHWGDTFWGVCRGEGENHLGKLLMKVRDELRNAVPKIV